MWSKLFMFFSFLTLLVPAWSHASSCCVSATLPTNQRLRDWEDGALGLNTTWSRATGRWSASEAYRAFPSGLVQDDLRLDVWGMLRLTERWQASVLVPWVTGLRFTPREQSSVGSSVGDISLSSRYDILPIGQREHTPGIAVVAQVVTPTGRRPEVANSTLGADATGRGHFATSLGVALEYAPDPWFVRWDFIGVYNLPFVRGDTQQIQQFGFGFQSMLAAGRQWWNERLVTALTLRYEQELDMRVAGASVPNSGTRGWSTLLSVSYRLNSYWHLVGSGSVDSLGRVLQADNREEQFTAQLGFRYAFF